jgi:hypothetical protein
MAHRIVVFVFLLTSAGALLPLAAQGCGYSGGSCSTNGVRTIYEMDANGNYTGQKSKEYNSDGDNSRYTCFPAPVVGPEYCNPCQTCHTATEASDKTFQSKFDGRRHMSVHFPSLWTRVGEKLAWGKGSHVTLRGTEVVVSDAKTGRDRAIFPPGSLILKNKQGVPSFIVLPAVGEPRILPP